MKKAGVVAILVCILGMASFVFADVGKSIYWTTGVSIKRSNMDGSNVTTLVNYGNLGPYGLDYDYPNNTMYWTNDFSLNKADLNGNNPVKLLDLSIGTGLALDREQKKIYFAELSAGTIRRSNLDGTNVVDVITGINFYNSIGVDIALDLQAGKIYWTQILKNNVNRKQDMIRRANLDGSGIEDFMTGLNYPFSIAIDNLHNNFYWINNKSIYCRSLSGSISTLLVTNLVAPRDLALDVNEGKLYWGDWSNNTIYRVNLDGTNKETVLANDSLPVSIVIVPEPASALLMLLGTVWMGVKRKRKGIL